MRKKLIALSFALTAAAAALGLFSPKPAEAACRGTLICCPNQPCFCCKNPCLVVCDPPA
jgi:hypothetical protein